MLWVGWLIISFFWTLAVVAEGYNLKLWQLFLSVDRTFWTSLSWNIVLWLWKKKPAICFCLPGEVFHSLILLCIFISVTYQFCKWCLFWCPPVHVSPPPQFYLSWTQTPAKREENCIKPLKWQSILQRGMENNIWQQLGMRLRIGGVGRKEWLHYLEYLLDSNVTWFILELHSGEVSYKYQQ